MVGGFFAASHLPYEVVRADDLFFETLAGVSDPEEKRRRIGTAFVRVLIRMPTILLP